MFAYTRLSEIFSLISNNMYYPAKRLANNFNITERTIRSDINEINDILKRNGAIIKLKRKQGYYIDIIDQSLYQCFINNYTKQESQISELESSQDRIKYLLKMLLYNPTYLCFDELTEHLYVGKHTLQNYLKTIKRICEKYHLDYISKAVEGIRIIGNEDDKRRCLLENNLSLDLNNYVIGFTKDEYALFKGIDLEFIRDLVDKNIKKTPFKSNDFNTKNLIIHLALMVSRIKNDCYINSHHDIIIPDNIATLINDIVVELEQYFDIVVSDGEKKYIYLHIIINTDFTSDNISDETIYENVKKLLNTIYSSYNFDLRNDEILIKDLFNHLKSILTTKNYDLNKRNPLLNTIKNNFPLPYEITLTCVSKVFNNQEFSFTEEEVGYIALHIGAAIERCFTGNMRHKFVILVCGSGQATSRMLEARINTYFKDKIIIVKRLAYSEFTILHSQDLNNIDFIISTIPLKSDAIPVINVNFVLTKEDIEAISKFLAIISNDKKQLTSKFFSQDLFFKTNHINQKEELLQYMITSLEEKKIVNHDFYESVMKRESLADTNMSELFALPHPMRACANETKVVVAILDSPIIWNNNSTVQIIFLLAISQEDQQDIEHLFDLFIEIVNNLKLQQRIINSFDFKEFIEILNEMILQ